MNAAETEPATKTAGRAGEAAPKPGQMPGRDLDHVPGKAPDRDLEPVRDWRIHIGAHKTATTHVQEILMLMRDRLVADGVDFIANHDVRRSGVAKALNRRRLGFRVPLVRGRMVQGIMADHLDPLRRGPTRMVLSEEKLLGGSQHVFSTPPYPMAGRIAGLLDALRSRADVTVYLSIRDFAKQLPSAYVQELKFLPPLGGGFDALRERVRANPPRWSGLVERIRTAAPDLPLVIWRQEDYRAHPCEILSILCGTGIRELPEMEDPFWTKSPSLEAVRAAEALPGDMPKEERFRTVLDLYRDAPAGQTRFDPFTGEDKAMFKAAYDADIARIREIAPGSLLEF